MAVIAGMAATNFAIRFAPITLLSRFDLPAPLLRWLSFIPVSVMGALVASEVMYPGGRWIPPQSNPGFFAAILTAVVYHRWRSFLGATVCGMVSFVILRAFMA